MGSNVMAPPTHKKYKFVKGDTLEHIAKKHKLRDGKTIWKAPENREIVSKRKKPEQLQPGDMLFIPPSEAQLKQIAQKVLELNKARDTNLKVRSALEAEANRIKMKTKVYDDLIAGNRETTDKIVAELEKNLRSMKNWSTGVDAAKMLTQMGISLGKLGVYGFRAAHASGEALKELNKKALEEAVELAQRPMEHGTVMIVSKLKDSASKGLAVAGLLAEGWEKMTAPSFWANTVVQMTQNGKSWSEAVTSEVGEDIEDRIKSVVADSAKQIKTFQDRQKVIVAQVAEIQPLMKECDARATFYETEAAKLGRH
jgi:LysM domain